MRLEIESSGNVIEAPLGNLANIAFGNLETFLIVSSSTWGASVRYGDELHDSFKVFDLGGGYNPADGELWIELYSELEKGGRFTVHSEGMEVVKLYGSRSSRFGNFGDFFESLALGKFPSRQFHGYAVTIPQLFSPGSLGETAEDWSTYESQYRFRISPFGVETFTAADQAGVSPGGSNLGEYDLAGDYVYSIELENENGDAKIYVAVENQLSDGTDGLVQVDVAFDELVQRVLNRSTAVNWGYSPYGVIVDKNSRTVAICGGVSHLWLTNLWGTLYFKNTFGGSPRNPGRPLFE